MISRRTLYLGLFVPAIAAALGLACSTPQPKVRIPPRIDLSRLGTLGLVDFASPGSEETGTLATREFLAALQSAQPGTPVLELGDEHHVLAELGRSTLDAEAVRAIGEKYRVDAVILGSFDSQRVAPKVAFDPSSALASASAELEGALNAKILDARSGATVWSTALRARAEIAGVQISDRGISNLGASPPDDARDRLVTRLIHKATADFWPHWE